MNAIHGRAALPPGIVILPTPFGVPLARNGQSRRRRSTAPPGLPWRIHSPIHWPADSNRTSAASRFPDQLLPHSTRYSAPSGPSFAQMGRLNLV